ncbi:MAG: hypothetical protein QM498_01835 [Desulfobacterium sp.]
MGTSEFAKLMMESAQVPFGPTAATDTGDHKIFTVPGKTVFSNKSGKELTVKPDGIVTGRNLLSPHADVNKASVAGFTCNLAGSEDPITATTGEITRPATDVAKVNSYVVSPAGTVSVIAGEDGATAAFGETRGEAGAPPYIPVGSVELGQVRVAAAADVVIAADEFFQTPGTHTERFDTPTWKEYTLGDGELASTAAKKNAYIELDDVVGDAIHAGDTYRLVHVQGYTPTFYEISRSVDFQPAENSYSGSSEQVYGETIVTSSSALGTAGFKAKLKNGITDTVSLNEGEVLTFKFYQNRNKTPYSLTQGKLGIATSFPAPSNVDAAGTIVAERKTVKFAA